jgi:hypothetical protein
VDGDGISQGHVVLHVTAGDGVERGGRADSARAVGKGGQPRAYRAAAPTQMGQYDSVRKGVRWQGSDFSPGYLLRKKRRWFSRPFDRRQVWAARLAFLSSAAFFPILWSLHAPYWWVSAGITTVLSWLFAAVRIGPRRRRQVVGLLPPDPPNLSSSEAYALAGWPGETAQETWLRQRRQLVRPNRYDTGFTIDPPGQSGGTNSG